MKVKSVRRITLTEPVPVYDLTVDETENFQLASGPVVHNSKDVTDAVAGVLEGLSKRATHRPLPLSIGAGTDEEVDVDEDGTWVLTGGMKPVQAPAQGKTIAKRPPMPFTTG